MLMALGIEGGRGNRWWDLVASYRRVAFIDVEEGTWT
jgi:hypothetical protein